MIYVTSDTHGDFDRFRTPAVRRLRRGDTLVVLGDFGFLWSGSAAEKRVLKKLGRRRYKLLFIDGSHENFDLLAQYPEVDFAGGRAQQLGKNLYRLQRGGLYTIEDKTLLVLGGGESLDRESRREGETWWPEELPVQADYDRCNAELEACGGKVDFILTHDAPARVLGFLRLDKDSVLYEENALELYLDGLMKRAQYAMWCFGRYHLDQPIGKTVCAVYKKVVPLWKAEKKRR